MLVPAVPLVTPEQHPSSCKKPSSLSISLVFPEQIHCSCICIHYFAFVYPSFSSVDCTFLGPFPIFLLSAFLSSERKRCLQIQPHFGVCTILTFSPGNPLCSIAGCEMSKRTVLSYQIRPPRPGQGTEGLAFSKNQ